MITKCPICSETNCNKSFMVHEMMSISGEEFKYILCKNCNTLYLSKIPDSMEKYYKNNYYSFSKISNKNPNSIYKKKLKLWRDDALIFGRLYSWFFIKLITRDNSLDFMRGLNLSKQSNILDVGSGSGALLHRLAESKFSNLTGIDPYILKNISYKNGLNIYKKQLNDVDGKFDLISFHHSFEHMENPLEVLHSAKKKISANGIIVLRIPIFPSFAWRKYRESWVQIDAPRHLHIFSVESIKILAGKSKLRVLKVEYDSNEFQFWGSEQCRAGVALNSQNSFLNNPKGSIFSKLDMLKFKVLSKVLNMKKDGDQVAIYLVNK
jgi:2-polyprenyl-3-methyl-5-hydroxy-6-metoxy-1,4-benzoquinol methylase